MYFLALQHIVICYHLHVRPGPCISELVYIHVPWGESLQGQLCLPVEVQDGLALDEAGEGGFQLYGKRCTHSTKTQSFKKCFHFQACQVVHCKINGLERFHPFTFQTSSMPAGNTVFFPGRRLEWNYLTGFGLNKLNLIFPLSNCVDVDNTFQMDDTETLSEDRRH